MHVLCYGDHARTTTSGCRPTATTSRRARRTCTSTRSPRALAHPFYAVAAPLTAAPPAPPGAAVPDLGDAQRLARQGAESAGVRVHRDPRGNRDRRAPMTTPESTSAVRSPRRRAPRRPRSSSPTSGRDGPPPTGEQGGAAKWAHSAMALAIRSLGDGDGRRGRVPLNPATVLRIVERVMREGDARHGAIGRRPRARRRARACCAPGCDSMDLDVDEHELLAPAPGRRA